MQVAPVQYNWEVDRSPWSPIFGALTGQGDGFLAQITNALGGGNGKGGGGGLLGLIMNGRRNRDDAKTKYGGLIEQNMANANRDIGLLDQFRKEDGTFDLDALKGNKDALDRLANSGIYNPTEETLNKMHNNANSYKDKFSKYGEMNYAANNKWSDYDPYQAYDPNTNYGATAQSNASQQGILPTQSMQATYSGVMGTPIVDTSGGQGNWKMGTNAQQPGMLSTGSGAGQEDGNWRMGTSAQPDAASLMQAATTTDETNLPKRNSKLSEQSQEAGQQATNDAVKAGMEAANKGPGLLGSVVKGAILGAATGGSAWAGALNGAKNWGLGQLGTAGQLYGAYQGFKGSNDTGADNAAATQQAVQNAQQPLGNWQTYSLAQPAYQMGNYGQSFLRNNGYGGLI